MRKPEAITDHYGRRDLLQQIEAGVDRLGKTTGSLTVDDLAPVDEFHIGGAEATRSFLGGIGLGPDDHALDIGCGLGGTGRFAAETFGCRVTGIDLTAEYVETGRILCSWLGMTGTVDLVHGDALATGFADESFGRAFMLHVGMNIDDKAALVAEAWRVLRPGGVLGIYDVMRMRDGALTFPVPWATDASASFVDSPDTYRDALLEAGFDVVSERDRSGFAMGFFERLQEASNGMNGPPPLGLHILMGENAGVKVQNMIDNVTAGLVAPVELIARKP